MSMQEDLDQNISETENPSEEQNQPVESEKGVPASATGQGDSEEYKPHRKVRTGVVISNKMDKSIRVRVTRRVRHPLYKKYFFKSKNFMAHDENNECNEGDTVRIVETRPLSANKRWRLEEIVERAK